ncbi:MAG: CBS domain-containing protein [Candidatus Lokiarchaeota archaeon]|nr:CBS domain-containing protein [Candidatus Lokiarchaeota archaeon]
MAKKKRLLAKDIEIKAPVTIDEDTPIAQAAQQMLKYNSSYIIVVDKVGKPVGIVTEKDFMIIIAREKAYHGAPVKDVMSKPLVTASHETALDDCGEILKRNGIKHLPITREGKLHGVITIKELLYSSSSIVVETHPLMLMILSKKNGLLLFEYHFPGQKRIAADLFSGAMSSFDAMFREVLHSEGEIKYIEIESNAILVEHGTYSIAILVQDLESIDSRKRLKLLEHEFEETHLEHLEHYSPKVTTNVFDDARVIVENLFSAKISRQ